MGAVVKGKGSVIPLTKPERTCKLWKLQVSIGYDAKTGDYKKRSKRFYGSKSQANKALREFIAQLEDEPENQDRTTTFEDYAAQWLKRKETSARTGTIKKDRNRINNLNLYMGKARICDIDEAMVKDVMNSLATKGGVAGTPLAGTSCQGVFITLGAILENATRKKLISSNPCRAVETKDRPKNDTEEKDPLTMDEARQLLTALLDGAPRSHTVGALLALMCGLGREELMGLRWCDVEFDTRCLRIENANTSYESGLVDTKNKYRRRLIPIDITVANRLWQWKEVQASKLKAKGITATAKTPVVSNPVGELLHPEAFGKWWRRYRAKLGLEAYGLHQLRHTYASILCASGTDIITASRLMGHSDTTMLSRVYAHMVPEYARQATAKVGSVLSGKAEIAPVPFMNS